jgi:hypothetical protein
VGARIKVQSGDDDADWNSPATTPQVPSNASRRATVRWVAGSSST